jgi:hypothetical protein
MADASPTLLSAALMPSSRYDVAGAQRIETLFSSGRYHKGYDKVEDHFFTRKG